MQKLMMMAVAAVLATIAGGNIAGAEPAAKVRMVGKQQFKANVRFASNLRFRQGDVTVASGDTVEFKDKSGAPHTVTIVGSQLATDWTTSYICLAENLAPFGGGACVPIFNAHGFGATPVIEASGSAAGLDAPGDSVFFSPGSSSELTISAPSGTILHYTCVIHPWMQGTITVE
jgi:plastocyanin